MKVSIVRYNAFVGSLNGGPVVGVPDSTVTVPLSEQVTVTEDDGTIQKMSLRRFTKKHPLLAAQCEPRYATLPDYLAARLDKEEERIIQQGGIE